MNIFPVPEGRDALLGRIYFKAICRRQVAFFATFKIIWWNHVKTHGNGGYYGIFNRKDRKKDIQDILAGEYGGKEVTVNGAVHKIRDMGDVAFVVLRKSEGLLQTVYEDGVTDISLKELQEEDTVCVTGVVAKEERAPHGFEIRLRTVTILSKPTEPMPIAINKWKMNTSLETKLDLRPLSLRNVKERAKFRIQEGIIRGFSA
jgi:nondiscriminating aspartyl-tRNA synthetase